MILVSHHNHDNKLEMRPPKDALDTQSNEESVLLSLGHEIINFREGFAKQSLKHTFVLSQYGSGMFGLMSKDGQLYLGIPELFYERFQKAKWRYAARVANEPGLFLVIRFVHENGGHDAGLRIFFRSKRVNAIDEKVTEIRAVPMDESGITRARDMLEGFPLDIKHLTRYEWEFADKGF
ncbi:hypothetical protein HNP46_000194 [Pseudomonas nitritireducens]|uniref:Uncharacterized protein n=1 Tax=Pseudomonas nitroreducens TaxID=46680 RepID=A0A7W7NY71_PSENT|nr:hypothetical protein [Pseudomonas nitritireducens]MBB4861383.1 hypothetical protein [Pseudomonas nitritireducens]